MDRVRIDVVVLTWNDAEEMQRAVASVERSEAVEARAVVVDNGSDPPARPHVSSSLVVRSERNLGVAGGRNLGLRHCDADYVCILDSDATLERTALHEMARVLERDLRVGLVAPVFVDQPPEASAGRAPSLARKLARGLGLTAVYGRMPETGVSREWPVEFAIGACQMFRREAVEAIGGLDESDLFGPEDLDLCLRIREAGWDIRQVGSARCAHPPRRAHRSLLTARGWRHGFAVLRFYAKRFVTSKGRSRRREHPIGRRP